jgi:hypothetical protein
MPIVVGPKIVFDTSSVAIAYDTGDIVNSYVGEPTTNILPNASANAVFTFENQWGTYNTNQYNGGAYFSIGTVNDVTNNIVTMTAAHPLRSFDVVTPQTTGGGVTNGVNYVVKKLSATQFSLHEYNSSQTGEQGYTNPDTGFYKVHDAYAKDIRVAINSTSFPTMWWGPPHLPNSGLIKEIIGGGAIRLHVYRADNVADGMAYNVDTPVTAGDIVTVSFYIRPVTKTAEGKNLNWQTYFGGNAATYVNTTLGPVGVWQRFTYTWTASTTYSFVQYWFPEGAFVGYSVDIALLQVEINKGHATPFTITSRSTTQGLLDISNKKNSINLAALTYNSNANFYFDGTDDYINATVTLGSTSTWELIIKSSNYNGTVPISIDSDNYVSGPNLYCVGNALYWNIGDGTTNPFSNSYFPNSNYHHIVIVNIYNVNALLYIDGNFIGTANPLDTTLAGSNKLWLGRWHGGGYQIACEIPVLRMYNKALSGYEIKQNYLSYKTRFNL